VYGFWEPPRPPSDRPRERTTRETAWSAFHLAKTSAPAMPSRTPGVGLPQRHGFATTVPVVDVFAPLEISYEIPGVGPPSTHPLCHWEHASLSSTPSADFCNRIRRADTPYELSIPTREQRLSPHYWPALESTGCVGLMVRCRTGGRRAASCTAKAFATAFHLRGRSSSRARALEQRSAHALDDVRVPFSWSPGHPGHQFESRQAWTT